MEVFTFFLGSDPWWSSEIPGFQPSESVLDGLLRLVINHNERDSNSRARLKWSDLSAIPLKANNTLQATRTLHWAWIQGGFSYLSNPDDRMISPIVIPKEALGHIAREIDRQQQERALQEIARHAQTEE
jgi:hypothetical protein